MTQRIIVQTICTATVREEWTIDIPDDLDLDRSSWYGAGWEDAIDAGVATIVKAENTEVTDERRREVTVVAEIPHLREAG